MNEIPSAKLPNHGMKMGGLFQPVGGPEGIKAKWLREVVSLALFGVKINT
jgi:hypothetical protein